MRGFITPDSIPTDTLCVRFSIPDSVEWRALIEGAILALTDVWDWQQISGHVSPDEAAEAALAIYRSVEYLPESEC